MYLTKKPKRLLTFLFLTIGFATTSFAKADFRVENDTLKNNNGYFQLKWEAAEDTTVILQQAQNPEFADPKVLYQGLDKATFISGLTDGIYYYRIKEVNGDWSSTYHVVVEHQSLQLAYTLFGIGALVFLLTVGVIYKGMKQVNNE